MVENNAAMMKDANRLLEMKEEIRFNQVDESTFKEQSTKHSIFEDERVVQDDGDDFVQNIVGATLADPGEF